MNLRLSPASRPLTLDTSGEVHAPHIWRFLSSCGAQVIGMDRLQESCGHGLFDQLQQDLLVRDQIFNTQLNALSVVLKLCGVLSLMEAILSLQTLTLRLTLNSIYRTSILAFRSPLRCM